MTKCFLFLGIYSAKMTLAAKFDNFLANYQMIGQVIKLGTGFVE
jgi:hypothetical protein